MARTVDAVLKGIIAEYVVQIAQLQALVEQLQESNEEKTGTALSVVPRIIKKEKGE